MSLAMQVQVTPLIVSIAEQRLRTQSTRLTIVGELVVGRLAIILLGD